MRPKFWPWLLHRIEPEELPSDTADAALMHARSQDDTHPGSTSHPGGAVMPAALAVAEMQGASGAQFLAAVILGVVLLASVFLWWESGREEAILSAALIMLGIFAVAGAIAVVAT